jgi:putative ABC transport system permease protein
MPFGNKIGGTHTPRLQKLSSIHYDAEAIDDDFAKGSATNLVVFSGIGLAILLLTCINYINLATARAGLRAKEIGIRKVLGSNSSKLRASLMMESMVQVLLALVLATVSIWLVITKSPLQSWLGADFDFNLFQQFDILAAVLLLVILTGIISGLYPSLYLSNIKPVKALKGIWVAGKGGNWMRQSLVLFQFVISIGVLTTTLLMKDQLNFLQDQDLGFDKDQILVINTRDSAVRANAKILQEA